MTSNARRGRTGIPWVPLAVVALLSISLPASGRGVGGVGVPAPAGAGALGNVPIVPMAAAPLNTSLQINGTSVNLSGQFFGTTVNNEVHMFRGEIPAVNATPARVLVWPGAMAGEDYDPIHDVHYDTYSGEPKHALTSEVQFVQLCREIHCTAIVQVPAEIDNPALAEAIVNYTEVNLSFRPAYWMIGNEPELWSHWKVPWKAWPTDYTQGPTPTQFGNEVVSYVKVIREVDNTTPILGLPASGCSCSSWTFAQWIAGVLAVTGNKIQAVAFHEYPAGWLGTGDGSLLDFYVTLQGAASIPVRMVAARAAVKSSCPGCNVSVFISELGSALSWSAYGQYAIGFSGSLSIASQITQAMSYNLSNIDLFAAELATTNSWFSPNGSVRPDYGLYTEILDHLGTQAFSVNVSNVGHSVYAIETIAPNDQGRRDLLVVNTNVTRAVTFAPQFAEYAGNAPVLAWYWNGSVHTTVANQTTWVEPYTPNAVPMEYPGGLPATVTLPQQSLMLFESYPGGGAQYVRINQTGIPNATRWYAQLGGTLYSTTGSNVSLLLPDGSYPVDSVSLPLPLGGRELNASEQLGPVIRTPLVVDGAATNYTIPFQTQWLVNVTSNDSAGGNVSTPGLWWDASQPQSVTATPAAGYAFDRWSGWGPGSYNGSSRTATLDPSGRILEVAHFVPGEEVDLQESGLPAGTNWSVTIRGFTTATTGRLAVVYEPTGIYGFSVSSVAGYRTIPADGAFAVSSSWSLVQVRFVPITPPGELFPVTFHVSGLPADDSVAIGVRAYHAAAGGNDAQFQLGNGSYGYQVGYVAGYHAAAPLKTFAVAGGPVYVDVPFVRTVYPVAWSAIGSRFQLNWSVAINGSTLATRTAYTATFLPNGTYPYVVTLPSNYTASPRVGELVVNGYATKSFLFFNLVEFPTWFEATGAGALDAWSVRFGNLSESASANQSSFLAANGSYTFDIHPPAGYYAVPSHGRVAVAGDGPPTEIHFYLTSQRPSAALVAALSSGALSVALWMGAAGIAGYALVRTVRRRGE